MKLTNRFYLALFMLIVSSSVLVSMASANPISRQQALQNAQAFLSAKGKNIPQSSLRHAPSKSASATTEYYYVFNVGDNAGYVIAAGDDCAPAILGYADTGSVDVDAMPDNMKTWLEEYDSQIKYMQERGISSSGIRKAPHAPITPLLTTTWDQGDPYNQNCPDFFTSGKCVTGCVATAMAQVMYYHRTKSVTATTTTIPAYDCSTNWTSSSGEVLGHIHVEEVPAGSIIDWDNMLDSYSSSATTVQKQAVANLMRYCGASVNMNYRNSWNGGSSASSSSVPTALKKYFNYSDDSRYVSKSSYSESDWDNLIYGELASQRPVLYRGSTTNNEGHAFVCDGYDGNGYYHINWGWSGQSDGFFLLTALDPDIQGTGGSSGGGFNDSQAAVVYAEPKGSTPSVTGISFADSNVKSLCLSNWDSNGDGQLTETEAAAVTSLGIVFKNNTSIKTFSELQYFTGLTSIVASAFEGCTALTTVKIPANVTAINSSAFKNCSKLSSITIPANVTTIGSNAFYGCSSLTSISIPAAVTSIASGAFSYCSGLTNMTVASGNTTYNSDSSCKAIIKTSSNQLIAGCKNTVIPSNVTSVGSYAFQGMIGLTAITIPAGVTSIASYAFDGCSALTSVTVENSTPVSIGSTVFSNRANSTLYVPAGSKSAYAAASYWKEFKEIIEPTTPSSDIITFADANVKALCVANWDTNGDGELSEAEAAAVTDLGSVFKYNSTITSFGELQYFTGLTSIGNSSFYNCSQLTLITIPQNVTSIGSNAFYRCISLTAIVIPSSVTSFGSQAFASCSGLASISVNSSNTVYDSRNNCNAIIEKASNTLVVGCKNSSIPSSVTSIGNYAFYWCSGLTAITIPSSVKSIGTWAFTGCSGLTSITIPSSVTSIGSNAFGSCSGLTSISVNSNSTVYDSRDNCNAIIEKASNTLIAGCKNTTIPSTVTSIGNYAFYYCSSLTSITIPSSVTSIGNYAFPGCVGLTSITIPSSVTSVGNYAFNTCSGLTSITIPSSVTSIGTWAFSGCSGLTSITIPSSVTSIGNYAFSFFSKLTSVTVEWSEPLTIEEKVFYSSNTSNATLYVPAGSKTAYEAADYWKEFKEIVEQSTPSSKNITFADTNVKALCVANWDTNGDGELSETEAAAVTDLGTVFKGNSTIVSFGELQYFTGLTSIGNYSFSSCSQLTLITIPQNVTSFGNYAFRWCSGLISITIPLSVTSIGNYAFQGCSGLNSITIPSSVTSIGSRAFDSCSGLTSISVNSTNTVYDSRNNCNAIIEKASNTLMAGCKNTSIPSSVTSIGNYAFYGCSGLTSITIPSSVTSIGNYVFYGCSGLTSITIPSSVTGIGSYAFNGCSCLTSITIPSSVTGIGSNAFGSCSGLASMSVNSSNTVYDSRDNCNAIIEKSSNTLIAGCMNTTIPSSVTSIGSYAFYNCYGLTSITIPSSVTSIGNRAFYLCSGLTSITIPSSVTSIGNYAFYSYLSELTSVIVEWSEPLAISSSVFYSSNTSNATLYVPAGSKAAYEAADYWKEFKNIVEVETQKYTLEISTDGGAFTELSHLYDRDGNEYEVADFSNNEFYAGSYIRIVPDIIPYNLTYIREIIVNGESVGTWTENTAPDEYVIEYLSCNTTVEFKTYYNEQTRTLGCVANGQGNIEMYRNGNYVGTTTTENPYDTHIKLITEVFEVGDVLKLVFVPDEGSTLTGFSGGPNDSGVEDVDLLADITDNTYTITFPYVYNGDMPLLRCFTATFEGPEPSTTNTLSAAVPTILTGKTATLSIGLTNEDEIIMTDFYMQLPDGISIVKDADGYYDVTLNSERSNRHNVEVDLNSEGLYHFLVYSTKNTALKGNDGELLSIPLVCEENMAAGTYQGMLKTIVMADIERNEITQENYSFAIEVLNVNPGDANADGRINGLDLVEVVDYIMERPSTKFVFAAADLNNDSKVNGLDLVREVDLIMSQSSGQNMPRRMAGTDVPLTEALHMSADGMGMVTLGVESGEEFILAQCTIALSDGQTLSDVKTDDAHQAIWKPIGGNRYSVLVYSLRNKSFASNGCLLRLTNCSGSISVEDVMLVDANREARCFADVTFNGVTGIESIANQNDEESVYDLGGRKLESRNPKLENLPKGIYIVNGKKVVVK